MDIAKAKFDAALLQDGRTHQYVFANTPTSFTQLLVWLRARATLQIHAALEATGCYGEALALFLHTQGVRVASSTRPRSRRLHGVNWSAPRPTGPTQP